MTISINWPTGVISVPKADMTLIQENPVEIRELNLNVFRLALKDLEDNPDGMPFTKTHTHNTEVTLGGLIYARVIEILEPYTVTFEDGQYAVNLVGANSNVGDRVNVNNVSVRSANSAGLISTAAVEYASFNGGVTIDAINGTEGTAYPLGTPNQPVSTVESALLIAEYRGLIRFFVNGDFTFTTGDDISEYIIEGQSVNKTTITIEDGAECNNCEFENATVSGVLDGGSQLRNCIAGDLEYVNGEMFNCGLFGTIELNGGAQATFANCNAINVSDLPIIDMGGSGQNCIMTDWSGSISFKNLTSETNKIAVQIDGGKITLDSTITAGIIDVNGIGILENNSTSYTNLQQEGLLNRANVSTAVWDESIGDHLISGSTGLSIGRQQFSYHVTIDTVNGTSGTTFPIGTEANPVDNLADAITIADSNGLEILHFESDYTFDNSVNISNFIIEGANRDVSLIFEYGSVLANCTARYCTVTGQGFGIRNFKECTMTDYTSTGLVATDVDVLLTNCFIKGDITVPSNYTGKLQVIDCRSVGNSLTGDKVIFDAGGANSNVVIRNWVGSFTIKNNTADNRLSIDIASGRVELDSTCTAGDFRIRGIGTFTNNSTGTTINTDGFINKENVAIAVWDEPIGDHLIDNTTGHQMYHQAYDGIVYVDVLNGAAGTTFPTGTSHEPCDNLADALTIAAAHYIPTIHVIGDLTIDGEDVTGFTIAADRSLGNSVTITSMVNTDACYFQDITVSGALSGSTRFTTCVLGALTGFDGGAKNSLLTGDITITGTGANYFTDCDTYITDSTYKQIDVGDKLLNLIRCRGSWEIDNYTGTSLLGLDFSTANVSITNTCTSGTLVVNGLVHLEDNSAAGCTVINATVTQTGIADKVWDEQISDHVESGSTGSALGTASSGGVDYGLLADAIWNDNIINRITENSAGLAMFQILSSSENDAQIVDNDNGTKTVTIYTSEGSPNIYKTYTITTMGLIETKEAV